MNWDEIKREFETTNISLKALAEKYGLNDSTIRSRKNRENWQRNDATQRKNVATPKRGKSPPKREISEPINTLGESGELTDKQRLFCIYYIQCWNATKAYQKAYGCAYSTAMQNGHQLLRNTKISAVIDQYKSDLTSEKKLNADVILQKYIDIAFADITDFIEFGQEEVIDIDPVTGEEVPKFVNRVKFRSSNEVDGTIINEVRQGKDGVSVKLADKMKALEILSKYVDLLPDSTLRKLQEEKLKLQIEKAKSPEEKESANQPSIDLTALTEEELMSLESIIGKSTNAEPDKS